jgi:hypothetical protein
MPSPDIKKTFNSDSGISTHSIFGQIRYLETVSKKLIENGVWYENDIRKMSKDDFFHLLGRVSDQNRKRIRHRMREIGLTFSKS